MIKKSRAKIGILCPSRFEYEALDKKALSRKGAALILSGMGKVRAIDGCARLREAHPSLESILLVGFAGGLTPDLSVGDVIEPHIFIEQDYFAEPFEKFPNLIRSANGKLLKESRKGAMLTQDRFLKENPYKRGPYRKRFKTIACDMESYAVAHYCRRAGIRLAAAKLISDSADASADHDFLKACRELAPKLNRVTLELLERLS